MDSSLLKVFVAVAKNESISLGAEELKFTQSNVTLRIKQLEKQLGFQLFHRVPKGVKLTYEGEQLLPYAKEITTQIQVAKLKMQNLTEQKLLRIGTSQANATIRLLPFIEKIKNDFSDMELELYANGTPQVLEKLLDYKIDIAFVMGKPKDKNIMVLNQFEDTPYIVESKKHTSQNTLIGYREQSTHLEYLKKYLKKQNNSTYKTIIMENYEVLLGCVKLGMGKAFLSKHIVEKYGYENDLKFTKVEGLKEELDSFLVCRCDNIPKISKYLQDLKLK